MIIHISYTLYFTFFKQIGGFVRLTSLTSELSSAEYLSVLTMSLYCF